MSNEEFQNLVLSELKSIRSQLDEMEAKNSNNHISIMKSIDEVKESSKSLHEILGRHEEEITTLKRKIG